MPSAVGLCRPAAPRLAGMLTSLSMPLLPLLWEVRRRRSDRVQCIPQLCVSQRRVHLSTATRMSSDAARMLRACRQLHDDCAMVGLGVQAGAGSWRPFAWMSTRGSDQVFAHFSHAWSQEANTPCATWHNRLRTYTSSVASTTRTVRSTVLSLTCPCLILYSGRSVQA